MVRQSGRRVAAVTATVLFIIIGLTLVPGSAGAALVPGSPFGLLDVRPAGAGISISGWVVDFDSTQPLDIHVYDGQIGLLAASADRFRPDVGAAFPGTGDQHGFELFVPAGAGVHVICVYGINVGPGANSLLACRKVAVATPFGSVDIAERVPNGVRIAGWVADPDSSSSIDAVVEVAASGRVTVRADIPRPDVERDYPYLGAAHGFDVVLPLPSVSGNIPTCVYGLSSGGEPAFGVIDCRPVLVTQQPYGAVDVIGAGTNALHVSGWAIDPDTTDPITVGVSIQNVGVLWVTANLDRPDLAGTAYGTKHGFAFDLPIPGGVRGVCVAARNAGPGAGDESFGCSTIDPAPGGSGSGRRIVYANLSQHVWILGSDGLVVRSYDVSGRYLDPPAGTYSVLSHLRYTTAGHDDISMEYFVEFLDYEKGYGFHTIPVYADGTPLQKESELGQFRSAGCVRQRRADAVFLYRWSEVGDPVVVLWR